LGFRQKHHGALGTHPTNYFFGFGRLSQLGQVNDNSSAKEGLFHYMDLILVYNILLTSEMVQALPDFSDNYS